MRPSDQTIGKTRRENSGACRSLVLGRAEAQDGDEDEAQEDEAQSCAKATTEGLGEVVADDDNEDDLDEGDTHQDQPPPRATDNLCDDVQVVEGDEAGPAGLSRLGEDFPRACDDDDENGNVDEEKQNAGNGLNDGRTRVG